MGKNLATTSEITKLTTLVQFHSAVLMILMQNSNAFASLPENAKALLRKLLATMPPEQAGESDPLGDAARVFARTVEQFL
jgi:hypothetical protein